MRVYTSDRYLMKGKGAGAALDPDAYIRGRGIGSIFSNIFSSVVPFIKGALKLGSRAAKSKVGQSLANEVKKSATQAGLNVVSDALQGKNVVQSSRRELAKASRRVGQKVNQLANSPNTSSTRALRKASTKRRLHERRRKTVGGGRGRSRRRVKRKTSSKRSYNKGRKRRVPLRSLFS